jgi:protein-S-isoprenylcysteine O-methyltransferase
MQLFLHNWLNLVLNTIVLSKFFTIRIRFEEWHLVNKIFGNQYVEYRQKVGIWIPFVSIKDPTR